MHKFRSLTMVLVLATVFAACSGSNDSSDPKARLREYISKSFKVGSVKDRSSLEALLTGEAKIRLVSMTDDRFREEFVDKRRKFLKLKFREIKKVSEDELSITYEISYVNEGKAFEAKVTNKKLCYMKLVDNLWYISDVQNIKELVEYKNALSLP